MKMFVDGKDQGYRDNPRWWFEGPDAFRIANLDEDYPAEYFPLAEPSKAAIEAIVKYVKQYYQRITTKELKSVIEFGCGGGWILEEFKRNAIVIQGIEGSSAGYIDASSRGLGDFINHNDLRRQKSTYLIKYGIALFLECAEHIEIPFHSKVVSDLTSTSNLIWFSSESPEVPNRPHLHHPGEMPLRYWQNLFAFYGYGCYMLPDHVFQETEGRGKCIFYNKQVYTL